MVSKPARVIAIAVALLLLIPSSATADGGKTEPLIWDSIPCAAATVSDAVLSEYSMRAGGELRLSGEITPCRPATNQEWLALGIYPRWRFPGGPLAEAKVDYRTLYALADASGRPASTNFVITPRFVNATYETFGVCVVSDFDTRLVCFRVDDPDQDARGDLTVTRIPTDDPLVNRRLADRVPQGIVQPRPVCGTCW